MLTEESLVGFGFLAHGRLFFGKKIVLRSQLSGKTIRYFHFRADLLKFY
jgi:hypothetical protein